VVKQILHNIFSPGPVNRCATAAWAMSRMISFKSDLHNTAFQADLRSVHRLCEGAGAQAEDGQRWVGASILLVWNDGFQ
jgi:hypothetical protein